MDKVSILAVLLKDELPHGSGFDTTWNIEAKHGYIRCNSEYHCMNENGYYDGWCSFVLIVPAKEPMLFALHFTGNNSQYLASKYMLRDYLEDTLAQTIDECVKQLHPSIELLGKSLQFISDSQDVTEIRNTVGRTAAPYDSYFVEVKDGDYKRVYGMQGIVPLLSRTADLIYAI